MKKPIIAVDIDDVLAAHAEGFVAFSNKKWGTNLTIDDYDEHWAKMWEVENEEVERRSGIYRKAGIIGQFRHDEDAVDVLNTLKQNYELVIVTSRRKENQKESLKWIERCYPGVFSAVHFAGIWDKITNESHTMTKADLCQEVGVSYLIDDQIKHCEGVFAIGIKAILFGDYAWNRSNDLSEGIVRCHDWRAVAEYFNGQNRL